MKTRILRLGARYRMLRAWWNLCTYDEQCVAISLVWIVAALIWAGIVYQLGGAAYVQ